MERINQYMFYEFGKTFHSILNLQGDVQRTVALWPLLECQSVVSRLLDPNFFPLRVCIHEARIVSETLDSIQKKYYSHINENGDEKFRFPSEDDAPIPVWQFSSLQNQIRAFETVFSAELRESAVYFVPSRGIFHTPDLVNSADKAFPEELRSFITEKTREDWRAAGRCLAFNLSSAAGFHIARAVEGMMEVYHQIFCPAGKKGLKHWRDYIADFESELAGDNQVMPSSRVISDLKQMKEDYRNPLMHPRVVLTDADARILLANGESVILRMAQEMQAAIRCGQDGAASDQTLRIAGEQRPLLDS